MSIHLSTHISAAPSGQRYLKFGIMDFSWKCVEVFQICLQLGKNIIGFTWRPEYVVLLPVTWRHLASTLLKCLGSLWGTNITWIHHSVTLYVHCISCPDRKFLFLLWMHTGQSITTVPTILQEADIALWFILHVALCYFVLILSCECCWMSWPYVWMCVGRTIIWQQPCLYCWTWANKIITSSTWVVFHCALENVTKFRIFWNVYQPYSLHVWLLLIQI